MPILSEWKKLYQGNDGRGITSESAIFVCNKWDEVENGPTEIRRKILKGKLSTLSERIFPNWMKNSKS